MKASDETESHTALQHLCTNYWFPLYAYARRRMDHEKAKDLTQEFFYVLLAKKRLSAADPNRGKFRAFLITSFKNFLSNEADKENAIKRGGAVDTLSLDFETADSKYLARPADDLTPDKVFERQWVLTLLNNVMTRLSEYYKAKGEKHHENFEKLKPTIIGQALENSAELAQQMGISSEAVRVQVHRMRLKYRELLRFEIGETVADPSEIDQEIVRLFQVLS